MTPEETEAYDAAKDIILRAEHEWWPYINLSPFHRGNAEVRESFKALSELTRLPPEIGRLRRCKFIELRGTKVADLYPLKGLSDLEKVAFAGIPACDIFPELGEIAEIEDAKASVIALQEWLADRVETEPPDTIPEGPVFVVSDEPPIVLIDAKMDAGDDNDQAHLLEESRIKAVSLHQIAELANNVAPRLPKAIERYNDLIHRDASEIGARSIWSNANTLRSIWEVHQRAVQDDRPGEELPPTVAACLDDLLQTHSVWFLGHPGAREVDARASKHHRVENAEERRNAAIRVVEAAEQSGVVSAQALAPARANAETSGYSTPSGVAALGELEDWAWNLIASTARKLWLTAKEPPGGLISGSIGGAYLAQFVFTYEAALAAYATEFMSHGPIWWDAMLARVRRSYISPSGDRKS